MNLDDYKNLNINTNLNNIRQGNALPNNIFFNNFLNNPTFVGNVNNNNNINENELFLNNFIQYNNNIKNVNKNQIKNNTEPFRFGNLFDKSYFYNYNNCGNNQINEDLNFYSNKNPHINSNICLNNSSYLKNLDINNCFNKNVNININNHPYLNKSSNERNIINQNINNLNYMNNQNNSLTSVLCNKKGINDMKILLKRNQNNIDLIRKIILVLNEENGLHIVFENIYGNYFIQELFQKMNQDLIQLTLDLINSEFVNIAKTPSGTYCLQKMLDYVANPEMGISIIKAIKYKEKEMAFDDNATYVLQKIISIIPDKNRIRLNNFIIDNAKELSLNPNSVFVLKRFIATNTIEENKHKLISIIIKYFLVISQNPFGNYVIQYLFEVWPTKDCELIINEILNKVINLSTERFSANIVIKALNIFNNDYKTKLILILCFSPKIINILKNKYSYYVVNKAITYMDKNTKSKFELYLEQNKKNSSIKEKMLINDVLTLLKN